MDPSRPCRPALLAGCLVMGAIALGAATIPAAWAQGRPGDDTPPAEAGPDDTDTDTDTGAAAEPTPTPTPAPPPTSLSGLPPAPTAEIDIELVDGLERAGLLDEWVTSAPTDPRLTALRVVDGSGLDSDPARDTFLAVLGEFNGVRDRIAMLGRALHDTETQARRTRTAIEVVDARIAVLDVRIGATEDRLGVLGDELDRILDALKATAVGLYIDEDQGPVSTVGDVAAYNDRAELTERVDATFEELGDRRTDLEARIVVQQRMLADQVELRDLRLDERAELVTRLDGLEATIADLSDRIDELTDQRATLREAMPDAIETAHTARMTLRPVALPFSLVTLDAYVTAVELVPEHRPGCGIRWELLAGIAKIESGHATFGGASVGADGELTRRILGPLLDGSLEGTMVIEDTDGGRLDGNSEFDAAVGPFQFIPGTWSAHALDGDDDAVSSPHNLYDAALTAAGYLCASSDVTSDADVERSVLSYNRSRTYLANVTRQAREYATAVSLPEPAFEIVIDVDPPDAGGDQDDGTGTPLDLPFADD